MTQKEIYLQEVVARMMSAGANNWQYNDMQYLCEEAGIFEKWLETRTRQEEEKIALEAASILGVEIRHYIPGNIYEGTRNKLAYVTTKLSNMIDEFYIDGAINKRFTPNNEACEQLECDISRLEEIIYQPNPIAQPDDWKLIKKYCSIADEFRTRRMIV